MANYDVLIQSVVVGDESKVAEQTKELLAAGVDPLDIINNGLVAGMNIVGTRFKAGDMFVPEVLVAAKAMADGVNIVRPLIADKDIPTKGKVLIGTVKGDLHDIGKNLVAMLLESAGYTVVNLGNDIAPEKFVEMAKLEKPDIVGMSSLLTTSMPQMKSTVELVKKEGLSVKCIIGGAPVTQNFADNIGADGFSADAASAVELCDHLLGA